MKYAFTALLAALIALTTWLQAPAHSPAATIPLTIMSWNVESGGSDAVTIAGEIAAFEGVDLWGLSEVNGDDDALLYETGAEVGEGATFARITGTTGGADRLVALYDDDRFDLLGSSELDEINVGGNVRASLVVTLEESASGVQFLFMVNHLYRSNEAARHTQATLLNEWAAAQSLPVIATGDYNFDWDVSTEAHDLGYDLMTTDGVWEWLKPATLTTTQCSGWPCAFNSVLDFVFVAGSARDWQATSEIIVCQDDFPDDMTTSDHRPVRAVFDVPVRGQDISVSYIFVPLLVRQPELEATPEPTAMPTVEPTAQPTAVPTIVPTVPPSGPCPCNANTLNCSNFSTQSAAQACFDWCVSQGAGDIHRLDGNNDGVACESLPGGFRVVR
ncbi:MAG: endonuclease/exonuclease/phosphatase family protein [Caldilineaceae bacterium]|nr:endonuclease/exonuclease/phosphatase family protein [Caldilineaceae bacterium]